MKRATLFLTVLALVISPIMVMATEGPVKAGHVTIPRTVAIGDNVLRPGTYTVQLVPKQEGMFIQFVRRGKVIAEDLAIVRNARFTRRTPRIRAGKVWNQNFYKVTIHYGDKLYTAFLPIQ